MNRRPWTRISWILLVVMLTTVLFFVGGGLAVQHPATPQMHPLRSSFKGGGGGCALCGP